MTTTEAIEKLEKMQSQIVNGHTLFGDIADQIRRLDAALRYSFYSRLPTGETVSDVIDRDNHDKWREIYTVIYGEDNNE